MQRPSKTAGQVEKERLDRLILDKQAELESKQHSLMEDLNKAEKEIEARRKKVEETRKELVKWQEEQSKGGYRTATTKEEEVFG